MKNDGGEAKKLTQILLVDLEFIGKKTFERQERRTVIRREKIMKLSILKREFVCNIM